MKEESEKVGLKLNIQKMKIMASCWEGLGAGREGDDRGWDGWMASLTRWTGVSELRELVMDREAWSAAIHGVAKSQTWLSDWTELNWLIYCSLATYLFFPLSLLKNYSLCGSWPSDVTKWVSVMIKWNRVRDMVVGSSVFVLYQTIDLSQSWLLFPPY